MKGDPTKVVSTERGQLHGRGHDGEGRVKRTTARSCRRRFSSIGTVSSEPNPSSSEDEAEPKTKRRTRMRIKKEPKWSQSDDVVSPEALCKVPNDPRSWSRDDVRTWLLWAQAHYTVGELDAGKFIMNGKGLCLMDKKGFVYRVPAKGEVLYLDFQERLFQALKAQRKL
ncbi:hypothetical protein Bbelb_363110 [Branchiostoma belcheri]|nr:hypothetical protein Bbelb_363110 [Branchiostoma belcheri]